MRKRVLGIAAAGIAASLVLGACSGSVGGNTTSANTPAPGTATSSSGGSATESSGSSSAPEGPIADTINIGLEQTPGGYNCNNAASNSVYCGFVDNVTQNSFVDIQPDGSLKPNTEFGSYEKSSDDPLTVDVTIADGAVWSDGVPIDFDDVLLQWAAFAGKNPNGTNADGNPVDAFDAATTNGFAQIAEPAGAAGDKTFTWVFETPYVDWEGLLTTTFTPAHIVAEQAGLSSADNGAELIAAIQDKDAAKIAAIGEFWSTGFDYEVDLPTLPDTAILPSSGPYKVDNAEGGSLTVVRNDAYWGTPAVTDTLVFKLVDDQEWVQAMVNGEIDAFDPSNPSGDTIAQLDAAADTISYEVGEGYTFSHVDFNSGPGGAMENALVRQAFEMCVPRQELVDKYAKPVFEGAQVLNLREFLPAQGNYQDILDQVPSAKLYENVDIEGAKAKLAEAGRGRPLRRPVHLRRHLVVARRSGPGHQGVLRPGRLQPHPQARRGRLRDSRPEGHQLGPCDLRLVGLRSRRLRRVDLRLRRCAELRPVLQPDRRRRLEQGRRQHRPRSGRGAQGADGGGALGQPVQRRAVREPRSVRLQQQAQRCGSEPDPDRLHLECRHLEQDRVSAVPCPAGGGEPSPAGPTVPGTRSLGSGPVSEAETVPAVLSV